MTICKAKTRNVGTILYSTLLFFTLRCSVRFLTFACISSCQSENHQNELCFSSIDRREVACKTYIWYDSLSWMDA
jgi:hypothetical protein